MEIESHVEAPNGGQWPHGKFPFRKMNVGDSFYIEFGENDADWLCRNLRESASKFKKRNPDFNYTSRTCKEGIRLWRIERD